MKLFIVERDEDGFTLPDGSRVEWAVDLPVGAMFKTPIRLNDNWGNREGWWIRLPGGVSGNLWHTAELASDGSLWTVEGEAPNITVTPSIHVVGSWHGWIRNGEIVDA